MPPWQSSKRDNESPDAPLFAWTAVVSRCPCEHCPAVRQSNQSRVGVNRTVRKRPRILGEISFYCHRRSFLQRVSFPAPPQQRVRAACFECIGGTLAVLILHLDIDV